MMRRTLLLLMMALTAAPLFQASAADPFITVASTTSTKNSGLYDYLLPYFTTDTGIEVRVLAVGTGQAVRIAQSGDADVLLVHHKKSEQKFVAEGYGVKRFDVMYNDFVIVGPTSDIAEIKGSKDVTAALVQVAKSKLPFTSRGDDSGTHKKELSLWADAGVNVAEQSGTWYRETGSGMGSTLNTASGMNAYALTDRSTWLKFANKGELEILLEGDERLFNPYGVILVNPARHAHIKAELGQQFVDWIVSPPAQALINAYTINGTQAFFANATPL
jgi:tungstate transport system substrate-binding protein